MDIRYNLTGERRKALVKAMSEILGEDASYLGAPSFAYRIDGYTVSQDGSVSCPDGASREEMEQLIKSLRELGYIPENEPDENRFTVIMPRNLFSEQACMNLQKIVASKASILKKALGAENLPVEMDEETIRFPWFTLHGLDGEADAYTRLISALCKMARTQKRVTAKPQDITNAKFTMRLFLIRLGFIGSEYKTARKILLRNLTGNSSWKNGQPPERAAENHRVSVMEAEGGAPYEK